MKLYIHNLQDSRIFSKIFQSSCNHFIVIISTDVAAVGNTHQETLELLCFLNFIFINQRSNCYRANAKGISYLKKLKFQKEVGVDIICTLQKVRKQAQKCYS